MPPLIRKIEPGDVIGRCRTIRELGRGGVGTVYLATHQTLQIEVALKVLSPSLSLDNPALAERFIRESQLAARIRHPNVIAVMDAAHDEETGLYYIVMEYIGGGALSWHLRHGALPEAKALSIVTGIAHALVIAEEKSIVHRDIKPDNIMLDLRGTPKLADLGLAKHAIDSHTSITIGGSFMGTPAYMSPEQARDAKIADTRDDIYSLGATFYECLTGLPPFKGETPYNIMSELLTKPSPIPSDHRPEVSRCIDLVCRKMMAKSRHLRYASARALLDDLIICQTFGDKALDQLEASSFDKDSLKEKQQARRLGVETSPEGVAVIPDLPDDSEAGPITRQTPALIAPRRADYGVFGAAALLVALVTLATVVLAWVGPQHPLGYLKQRLGFSPPPKPVVVAVAAPAAHVSKPPAEKPAPKIHKPKPEKPIAEKTKPAIVPQEQTPEEAKPTPPEVASLDPLGPAVTPPTPPVALPVDPADLTNSSVPAIPVDTTSAVPAIPAVSNTAFEARTIAESILPAELIDPTNGHAPLLKIVGKRDASNQATPGTWTFYFFDKNAQGHARIVTVSNGHATRKGEDIADALTPFHEIHILPENTLTIDSTQILQIAEGLMPGVTASNSQMELAQNKSIPTWKIVLWAKAPNGEEEELGNATILAASGEPSANNLHPERLK